MASCDQVCAFLTAVRDRNVTSSLAPEDLAQLQQLQIIQLATADQYQQMTQQVQNMTSLQQNIASEMGDRARLNTQVQEDSQRTHSVLFHLSGHDKQATELAKSSQDQASLQATDRDLAGREAQFNQLVGMKSMLDTMVAFPGGYVGLTGYGALQLRDLGVRLYRVSDLAFATYWQQTLQVAGELNSIADRSGQFVAGLQPVLANVDRSYLWSASIGMAKQQLDVSTGVSKFLQANQELGRLAYNEENRLMSAEMLVALPRTVDEDVPLLKDLEKEARKAGVPKEASLGVASILLLGQRADGTFATANLPNFLQLTHSYESAALLAIVNAPFPDLAQKFGTLRSMYASWGFRPSEDVELSSAYLTISELPADSISTKLAILVRGLAPYLQYPLVAGAILSSIPVLEANDTLNLLEEAYEVIGKRAMPATQPELICLAVRMVHGIRVETVTGLDTTATAPAAAASTAARGYYRFGPPMYFVPLVVTHGAYYSTFSGVEGVHPAHAHVGGFAGGGGGGGSG